MENFFNNQFGLFLMYMATGIIICLLFDIFRALRKAVKTPDFITYIEDILFWIISLTIFIYLTFIINSGEIRLFLFIGLALGGSLYYFTLSKFFMKITVEILIILKRILIMPINILLKLNKKIICFICINLQNVTNVFKKLFKKQKINKKNVK